MQMDKRVRVSIAEVEFIRTSPESHAKRLLRGGAINRLGVQQIGQHPRRNLNEESAVSPVDIKGWERKDAALDKNGQKFARAEGRSAAHLVARLALGEFRLAGFHFFRANLPREILQAHLAIPMHQDEQGLRVLVLHHQSLDDRVLVNAQLPRGLGGTATLTVVVEMFGEVYVVLAKKGGRRSLRGMFLASHEEKVKIQSLLRRSSERWHVVLRVFRGVHLLPFAMNDALADLRGRLALARLLVRVKGFLLADVTAGAVAADKTIEKAAMSLAAIAVAIAGLLVEN